MATRSFTEFVVLKGLKPDFNNPGSSAHQKWQALMAEYKNVLGARRTWFGICLEDPNIALNVIGLFLTVYSLQLAISKLIISSSDWPSVEAFNTARNSPDFARLAKDTAVLTDGAQATYSVVSLPEEGMLTALNAPVNEFLTAHGVQPGFLENIQLLTDKMAAEPPKGYLGAALGEIDEEMFKNQADGVQKKEIRFIGGWESAKAHDDAMANKASCKSAALSLYRSQ
jgi:hypothetical protein